MFGISYLGFARKRATTLFIFSNVPLGTQSFATSMLPARYGLTGPALEPKNYTQNEGWEIGDMVWLKIFDERLSLI